MHESQALLHDAFLHRVMYDLAMTDMRAGVRRYLEYVLGAEDLSATALAKKAGIASSTLTRFLNRQEHRFVLTSTTISKIEEATGINPAPFIAGADVAELSTGILSDIRKRLKKKSGSFDFLMTVGELGHGLWREMGVWQEGMFQPHFMIPSGFDVSKCFGLLARGSSSDLFVKDGEYVICVQPAEYSRVVKSSNFADKIVIVETRSADESLIELTARAVFRLRDNYVLSFPSSEQGLKSDQIVCETLDRDLDDRRRVIGVALAVVRYVSFGPQPF